MMQRNSLPGRHKDVKQHEHSVIDWSTPVKKYEFTKMECNLFVPTPGQPTNVTKRRLRCHCGDTFYAHARVKEANKISQEKVDEAFNAIVPKQLHRYLRGFTEEMPTVDWFPDRAFESSVTDSYGKINFKDGDKKPAKYIRVGAGDSVNNLLLFMTKYWKIMEPCKPELVIYVTGGAKNFKLPGRILRRFHDALINVADSTSAWLITSGFSVGLMQHVGEAVRDGQSFSFNENTGRAMHNLKCIGIGPWGNVLNSDSLVGTHTEQPRNNDHVFRAEYRKEKVSPETYHPLPLDSNVTHFVLVDNGYRNRHTGPGSVSSFVTSFLKHLSNHAQNPMNLVTLMVNGGKSAFEDIEQSIRRDIPVVVCEGTDRAADVFADAYWHSNEKGELSADYQPRLAENIDKIESNWYSETEKQRSIDVVIECCRNKHLITIFDIRRNQGLDDCLLQAVIKGKKHSWDRYYHFNLAFACNKAEFAETELLKQTINFRKQYLVEKLTEAIVSDKCDFVRLLLKQDIDLTQYLTRKRLTNLYNKALESDGKADHLHRLLVKCTNHKKTDYTLGDVGLLLDQLIYRYDKTVYCVETQKVKDETDGRPLKHIKAEKLNAVRRQIFDIRRQESDESLHAWTTLVDNPPGSENYDTITGDAVPESMISRTVWQGLVAPRQSSAISETNFKFTHSDDELDGRAMKEVPSRHQRHMSAPPGLVDALLHSVPKFRSLTDVRTAGNDTNDETARGSDETVGGSTGKGAEETFHVNLSEENKRRGFSNQKEGGGGEEGITVEDEPGCVSGVVSGVECDRVGSDASGVIETNETKERDLNYNNKRDSLDEIPFIDSESNDGVAKKDVVVSSIGAPEITNNDVITDNLEGNGDGDKSNETVNAKLDEDVDMRGDMGRVGNNPRKNSGTQVSNSADDRVSLGSPFVPDTDTAMESTVCVADENKSAIEDGELKGPALDDLVVKRDSHDELSRRHSSLLPSSSSEFESDTSTDTAAIHTDNNNSSNAERPVPSSGHFEDLLNDQHKSRRFKIPDAGNCAKQTVEDQLHKADRDMFIWAVLNNRAELAKYFWEYSVQPISTALMGAWLCKKLLSSCENADSDLIASYTNMRDYFEKMAKESLDAMTDKYPQRALELLDHKVARWSDLTCMQIASVAECRDFVSSKTVQAYLKNKWRGGITSRTLQIFFSTLFFPLFMFVSYDKDSVIAKTHQSRRCKHLCDGFYAYVVNRFVWFYSSPMVKYIMYTLTYVMFLLFFTFMVLFKVEHTTNITQCAVCLWVVSYICDELHRMVFFPIPSVRWKLIDNEGYSQILYMLNSIMMVTAFLLHAFVPDHYDIVRTLYCVNLIIYYIRLLRAYTPSEYLGPKLYIIVEALKQLMLFFMILFVFLIAYGVASYATLYPHLDQTWAKFGGALKHIFFVPYWNIYGELMLDEFENDEACYRAHNISADQIHSSHGVACRTSSLFLPVLLAVYLFVGNVLLMNLIIAIFSRIFEKIEDNSTQVWRYQMYYYITEYDVKSYLPPPLNLIEYCVRITHHIYAFIMLKRCSPRTTKEKLLRYEVLRWLEEETNRRYLRKQHELEENSQINLLKDIHIRLGDMMTSMRDIEKLMVQKGGISREELRSTLDEFGAPMDDDYFSDGSGSNSLRSVKHRRRFLPSRQQSRQSSRHHSRQSSRHHSRQSSRHHSRRSSLRSARRARLSSATSESNIVVKVMRGWYDKIKGKARHDNKQNGSDESTAEHFLLERRMEAESETDAAETGDELFFT